MYESKTDHSWGKELAHGTGCEGVIDAFRLTGCVCKEFKVQQMDSSLKLQKGVSYGLLSDLLIL